MRSIHTVAILFIVSFLYVSSSISTPCYGSCPNQSPGIAADEFQRSDSASIRSAAAALSAGLKYQRVASSLAELRRGLSILDADSTASATFSGLHVRARLHEAIGAVIRNNIAFVSDEATLHFTRAAECYLICAELADSPTLSLAFRESAAKSYSRSGNAKRAAELGFTGW
jgi:hypothetical protein